MATKRKRRADLAAVYAEPTPEQFGKGQFRQGGNLATGRDDRNGVAYRRIPVIDTMAATGKLTARQHHGLSRYRDIAAAHEKSPMRDSLDKALHGRAGATDGTGYFRTAYELQRLENALGALFPIAHAIAVDDMTASQWAIKHWGGREKRDGNVTYIAPRYKTALPDTILDIQMAGERLAAAIGA
jgi:hypothetical protein